MLVMPLLPLYMTEEFGAGKHTIGVVLSGYTVTALFARLFSGYIVDTFNRRTVLLLSYGLFACFFLGYLIGGSMILFAIVRTMHGAPFGTTTVANSTVAIDVLPSVRRAEGIGYYGLANNLGTAISPTIGSFSTRQWAISRLSSCSVSLWLPWECSLIILFRFQRKRKLERAPRSA